MLSRTRLGSPSVKSHPGLMKGDHLPDMDIKALREYIKIHRISLIQDNANLIQDTNSPEWNFLQGQIIGVEHILEVMEGYDD